MTELASLSSEDAEAAMATVLAHWRVGRQPELAAALDVLGARAPRPPIPGKTMKARHQAWLECGKRGDPADVPRLLAILLEGNASKMLEEKLEVLVARGPDPRVAMALVDVVAGRRVFVTIQYIWSRVLDAIEKMGDPGAVAALRAAIPSYEPARGFRYMGDREVFSLERFIWDWAPPIVKALEKIEVAPLSEADRAALARLRAPSRSSTNEKALLDAVYANPDDDAPRLVLADALQARGDARGELIALQIGRGVGGKVSAREKALVKALVGEVLGPLAPVVYEPVIERGFLAGARVVIAEHQASLCEHPWWRTVTSLSTDELRLIRRPDLVALRRVQPFRGAQELLAGEPLPRIAELVLTTAQVRNHAHGFGVSRALPALRLLLVEGDRAPTPSEAAPILDGALGAGLETLELGVGTITGPEIDAWHAAKPRPTVRLELPSVSARITGDALEIELRSKEAVERLRRDLAGIRLRVVVTRAPRGTDALVA